MLGYLTLRSPRPQAAWAGVGIAQTPARLALDLGTFRVAFLWASHTHNSLANDAVLALKTVAALARLYYQLPNWSEGNQILLTALALIPDRTTIHPLTMGRVELGFGVFQHSWGHYRAAVQHLEVTLALFRDQPDRWYAAWTMSLMGQCLYSENEIEATEALVNESSQIFQSLGDRWAVGFTTWQRAHLAKAHGDDAKATQLAQMSLAEFSTLNDRDCVALVNNLLGEIVFRNKHLGEAVRHYQNALDLVRTTNNPAGVAWTALLVGQALLGESQWLAELTIGRLTSTHSLIESVAVFAQLPVSGNK